jgi:hypothetical protein
MKTTAAILLARFFTAAILQKLILALIGKKLHCKVMENT